MEDRMDAASSTPDQSTGSERQPAASADLRRGDVDEGAMYAALGARPAAREDGRILPVEEPSEHAVPVLRLTPVPEPYAARDLWAGSSCVVVTGVTVMVITAELGRRSGASRRLTALCSAGAGAAAVAPWLVPQFVRRRPVR